MHAPTPQPNEIPARDEAAALECAGGDSDLAKELFAELLSGLPGELEDLNACLAESDWDGLAEHAHQVRGATRYCGVPALDEAIEALERAARIEDPQLIEQGFLRVESECARLHASE